MDAGALGVDRLCHGGSKVTEKPGPDRKLAIALENVTPAAVAANGADPAVPGQPGPRVVASRRGAVAEPLLQVAFERGATVRSDRDLAELPVAVGDEREDPLAAMAGAGETQVG